MYTCSCCAECCCRRCRCRVCKHCLHTHETRESFAPNNIINEDESICHFRCTVHGVRMAFGQFRDQWRCWDAFSIREPAYRFVKLFHKPQGIANSNLINPPFFCVSSRKISMDSFDYVSSNEFHQYRFHHHFNWAPSIAEKLAIVCPKNFRNLMHLNVGRRVTKTKTEKEEKNLVRQRKLN